MPFSAAEGKDARDWISKSGGVASASSGSGGIVDALRTLLPAEQVLSLLFARSGARTETPSQIVYWINTAGLSLGNRRLLNEIVEGLCAMDLQDQGKKIRIRLKDMPP